MTLRFCILRYYFQSHQIFGKSHTTCHFCLLSVHKDDIQISGISSVISGNNTEMKRCVILMRKESSEILCQRRDPVQMTLSNIVIGRKRHNLGGCCFFLQNMIFTAIFLISFLTKLWFNLYSLCNILQSPPLFPYYLHYICPLTEKNTKNFLFLQNCVDQLNLHLCLSGEILISQLFLLFRKIYSISLDNKPFLNKAWCTLTTTNHYTWNLTWNIMGSVSFLLLLLIRATVVSIEFFRTQSWQCWQ